MKNSSSGSSLFVLGNSCLVQGSGQVLLIPLEGLCPASPVLLSQPSLGECKPHIPACVHVRGRHVSSFARTAEAPTAAGLSELRLIKRSTEEERVIVLATMSEHGEMRTPVSTLVSSSSSSRTR